MHVVKGSGSKYEHLPQLHANFNSVPSVLTFESKKPGALLPVATFFVDRNLHNLS